MYGNRVSIGQVMLVIALVAVNLALVRNAEWTILGAYGGVLAVVDSLIVRKWILHRPLRAFDYTLLVVSVVGSIVLAVQVAMERLHLLGPIVRWYQRATGDLTGNADWSVYLRIGEFWAAGLLGFLIACSAGLLARRLEKNKGWDVAAFWRGALLGLSVLGLIQTLLRVLDPSALGNQGVVVRYGLLMAFVGLGGLMGLAKLNSAGGRRGFRDPPCLETLWRSPTGSGLAHRRPGVTCESGSDGRFQPDRPERGESGGSGGGESRSGEGGTGRMSIPGAAAKPRSKPRDEVGADVLRDRRRRRRSRRNRSRRIDVPRIRRVHRGRRLGVRRTRWSRRGARDGGSLYDDVHARGLGGPNNRIVQAGDDGQGREAVDGRRARVVDRGGKVRRPVSGDHDVRLVRDGRCDERLRRRPRVDEQGSGRGAGLNEDAGIGRALIVEPVVGHRQEVAQAVGREAAVNEAL
jgi:hypothetical protein